MIMRVEAEPDGSIEYTIRNRDLGWEYIKRGELPMTLLGNNKLGLVRHWVALYDLMLDFSPRELFGDNTKFSETPGVVWCKYEEMGGPPELKESIQRKLQEEIKWLSRARETLSSIAIELYEEQFGADAYKTRSPLVCRWILVGAAKATVSIERADLARALTSGELAASVQKLCRDLYVTEEKRDRLVSDAKKATEQYRAAEQHAREIAELLLRYTDKEHVC